MDFTARDTRAASGPPVSSTSTRRWNRATITRIRYVTQRSWTLSIDVLIVRTPDKPCGEPVTALAPLQPYRRGAPSPGCRFQFDAFF